MSWTSIFKGLQGGTGAGQRIFGGGGENSLLRKPVVDALGTNNRVNLTIHPLEFSIYTGASLEVCGGTNGEGLAPFHPPTSGQLKKYVKYVEWLNRVRITLPSSVDVSLARIHAPWNNDSFSVAEKQMTSRTLITRGYLHLAILRSAVLENSEALHKQQSSATPARGLRRTTLTSPQPPAWRSIVPTHSGCQQS